ncbi:glycosyltransferase family 4 protein [Pelistega suis]|uniref:glycosyltransferase family 4 protein n=1 Tax=Pelistega suis TaxID=1631957 RepID=UPI001FE4A0E0|nr:glycosyltransferase [Pelistega suis]
MKVVHLISGLGQGGAETVLTRLVTHSTYEHVVVSFSDEGVFGDQLREAGIAVYTLNMRPGKIGLKDLMALKRLLKELRPEIVQTWMYHADLFGGIVARMAGFSHLAWGVRNSGASLKETSKTNYYLARISAWLSRFIPQRIIVCGEQAAKIHASWGYAAEKMVVIQNGYNLEQWKPSQENRQQSRQHLGLSEDTPVLGFIARWNPLKDHPSLLKAFAMAKKKYPDAVLILVGKGLEKNNETLMALLNQYQLIADKDVLLLGLRTDVPKLMPALDIHVLSSIAEGFPNVVSESMACGVPNVVTDVGDAALIVGENGWVAEAANPEDLASKINEALAFLGEPGANLVQKQAFQQLQSKVRQSVLERFSIEIMVKQYESTWAMMLRK